MFVRAATAILASTLLIATPLGALAQADGDVYDRIEAIHGDADGFFEVFSRLQDAVTFGDPATFAQDALFPIMVRANGEMYDVLEAQNLLDDFDSLVSAETLDALVVQDIADLIVTDDGVGVGNGALWITNVCLDDDCTETRWGILTINN
jgi:hypothetical protein